MSMHRRTRATLLAAAGAIIGLLGFAFVLAGVDRATDGAEAEAESSTPAAASPEQQASPATLTSPADPLPEDPASGDRRGQALPPLPDTDDPDVYAAAVAEVLFGMDYTTYVPEDYEQLLSAALWEELTEDARSGVAATMGMRVPDRGMWEQMRSVQQTSEFEVESVWQPRAQAEADADPGVPDGVRIRNVTGTRTEAWRGGDGQKQTSTRPATVSVLVVCPPAASPCALGGISATVVQ